MKVLLFLDVGGSMDWHIEIAEELFSAARLEFKHFEHFYFHNCVYEKLWKENRRRFDETIPTLDVIRTYPSDYRVVFVGDASMSPYEITIRAARWSTGTRSPARPGSQRILDHFPKAVWLNPVPQPHWGYTQSIALIRQLFARPHVSAQPRRHRPGDARTGALDGTVCRADDAGIRSLHGTDLHPQPPPVGGPISFTLKGDRLTVDSGRKVHEVQLGAVTRCA